MDLHRRVLAVSVGTFIAEVKLVAGGARNVRGVSIAVVPRPELDVAGLDPRPVLDAIDVGEHVHVRDRSLEVVLVEECGDADLAHVVREGVHRNPRVRCRAALVQLEEVGDAVKGHRDVLAAVHEVEGVACVLRAKVHR